MRSKEKELNKFRAQKSENRVEGEGELYNNNSHVNGLLKIFRCDKRSNFF